MIKIRIAICFGLNTIKNILPAWCAAPLEMSFLKLLVLLIEIPASVWNTDPTFGVPIFFFFPPMRQMFECLRQGGEAATRSNRVAVNYSHSPAAF